MSDKDPNEDEFNQDEQDNINEADDSFGLPDLDFNTLEEEENEPEEPEAEEEVVEEKEPEVDEKVEEETEAVAEETEEEENEQSQEEEPLEQAVEAINEYADETELTDDYKEEEQPEGVDEEVNEHRTYVPPKPESNAPRIIFALLVTIVVSVAAWYFIFYKPKADMAEKARIEAENKKAMEARKAAEAKKLAEQRQAEANAAALEEEKVKDEASFSIITEPTKRYYIVVSSSIDADAATDYGKELASKGFSTALLSPKGKKKYNRLTMGGDYGTFVEAQEVANKLKAEFGDGLWVLKY